MTHYQHSVEMKYTECQYELVYSNAEELLLDPEKYINIQNKYTSMEEEKKEIWIGNTPEEEMELVAKMQMSQQKPAHRAFDRSFKMANHSSLCTFKTGSSH